MPPERDPSVEALIQDGRRAYAAKRYKNALEAFTRAMRRCPCAQGTKRERCACKNYEQVAADGGSIFHEAMYTCTCIVGTKFGKCDNSLHIQALDYRAATFEALKELERAKKDAEWILELDPGLPDGYLRLGKICRLLKKNELAWKVFNAGIDASVFNELPKTDPKVEKLYAARAPLHARYFRHDPLQLPLDIVHLIFSDLDLLSKLRSIRVCKTWRKVLTSPENQFLWRSIEFPKLQPRRNAPSVGALVKLLGYSGNDVRKLVIPDAYRLGFDKSRIKLILRACPRLEQLELRHTGETLDVSKDSWPRALKSLTLDGVIPPMGMFEAIAANLVQLDMYARLHMRDNSLSLPLLPKLRYCRLIGDARPFSFANVVLATPNIEQLWLRDVLTCNGDAPTPGEAWNNLQVLVWEGGRGASSHREAYRLVNLVSIHQGKRLRHIDLSSTGSYNDQDGFSILSKNLSQTPLVDFQTSDRWHPEASNSFDSLETLRLRNMAVDGAASEPLLRNAIANNKLRSIDISFRQPALNETEGPASCQRIQAFSWLRGAECIRTMGLFDFRFRRYPSTDEELPLPSFLATFPNLETLEIGSEYYDEAEFCSVVAAIMKRTKLKTVYQTTVTGYHLDNLQLMAKEVGVELYYGPKPRQWPVQLED